MASTDQSAFVIGGWSDTSNLDIIALDKRQNSHATIKLDDKVMDSWSLVVGQMMGRKL